MLNKSDLEMCAHLSQLLVWVVSLNWMLQVALAM